MLRGENVVQIVKEVVRGVADDTDSRIGSER